MLPIQIAFFLLIGVVILGVNYTDCEKGTISNTEMLALIIEFEIGLVIVVILSYTDMVFEYIFAYNVGLIMFAAAKNMKLNNKFFIRLEKLDSFSFWARVSLMSF